MSSQPGAKETEMTTNDENNQSYNITVKLEVDLTDDNINIKTENEAQDETDEPAPFNNMDVHVGSDYSPEHQKAMEARLLTEESELPLTKTHLISNKQINSTSTNTKQADNLIDSQTRKTVIIELLPMTDGNLSKIGIPEILPTNNTHFNYNEIFQFNSITGNIPSLEQEANELLKAKRKRNNDPRNMLKCPKCPKTYRYVNMLLRHLDVHKSIEKRKMGFIKGIKTRTENRKKKLNEQIKVEVKEEKVKKEGHECTCGNVYRTQSKMETCLRSHQLVPDTILRPCINCTKQFKNKDDVAKHRKMLHGRLFSCKFCQLDYSNGKELFEHIQAHRQVQMAELKFVSEVVEGKLKLECFICSRNTSELSDLLCHCLKDHTDPYTCQKCKKVFSKVVELVNHMKETHPDLKGQSFLNLLDAFDKLVKAWKCDDCNEQFYEADKLVLHKIETHRSNTKPESQVECSSTVQLVGNTSDQKKL